MQNKITIDITIMSLILAISCVIFMFPAEDNITGMVTVGEISASASVIHASINNTNPSQLEPVFVAGQNISIRMQVQYFGTTNTNTTLIKPINFECGTNWQINESGTIKQAIDNGTHISWFINKSVINTTITFEVPSPSIISEVATTSQQNYQKEISISSCAHLTNASANITVISSDGSYTLYEIQNGTRVDKTEEYHLTVEGTQAYFWGFNFSNKTFELAIQEPDSIEIRPTRSGGLGWGLEKIKNNTNITQKFDLVIKPNFIEAAFKESYTAKIIIYNPTNKIINLEIKQDEPIFNIDGSAVIGPDSTIELKILYEEGTLNVGEYENRILISWDNKTRIIPVKLTILKKDAQIQTKPQIQMPSTVEDDDNNNKNNKQIAFIFIIVGIVCGIAIHTANELRKESHGKNGKLKNKK